MKKTSCDYPVLAYLKTGKRIPYRDRNTGRETELVEWGCPDPSCLHSWWEYADADEYPECCPLCGYRFRD